MGKWLKSTSPKHSGPPTGGDQRFAVYIPNKDQTFYLIDIA